MTITVLIADDQPLMRSAMRTCLEGEPDITVVGEASNGAEAVLLAQRLRPAVVVMDVRMPIMDGIEATRRVVALQVDPPTRVLVMTTFDLDEYIIDALRGGASGFLVKDSTQEELVYAVRMLAAGQALLSPSVTRRLLELRARTLTPVPTRARDAALAVLTARELAVLELVARGLSNSAIATVLGVAPSSVKTHVGHLLTKLGLIDRVHLVVFAYDHELVRPGDDVPPEGSARRAPPTAVRPGTGHRDAQG
ncbi:MAG: putative two-component system response regulator, partial [Conexibacter sp.]|nr:putative two-component system response regulator [Conexibacter sp.]